MRKKSYLWFFLVVIFCWMEGGCGSGGSANGGSASTTGGGGSVGASGGQQGVQAGPPSPVTTPVSCPGTWDENFTLEKVRANFYTGKRSDAWTDQPVYLKPLGESSSLEDLLLIPYEVSGQKGHTTYGSMDTGEVSLEGKNATSHSFSKVQISLKPALTGISNWFLGGLVMEGLKQGCDPQDAKNWTPLYFNPFVRAWIDTDHPLILSREDAVAIFEVHVNQSYALPGDQLYGGTPFERGDDLRIKETPPFDYPNTNDLLSGQTYYYGRTYFAESENQTIDPSRLIGKFQDISSSIELGFSALWDGDGNVFVSLIKYYLVQPLFQQNSSIPFWGYSASRETAGLYGGGSFSLPLFIEDNDLQPHGIQNFGQTPTQSTAMGYLNWLIQFDNPGWIP